MFDLCAFPPGSPCCMDLSFFNHCQDRNGIEVIFFHPMSIQLSVRAESTQIQTHTHKHLLRVKGILEAYPGMYRMKNKEFF